MPSMTTLEIVQRFANAVGISTPTTAVANPSQEVVQIVELLNQEGRDLSRRTDWQVLSFQGTFTTVAAESQGFLATIIGATQVLRGIVNDTIWNRTTMLPIFGPLSKPVWQGRKALNISGPYPQYRIRGNEILFNPTPTAGQSCYFEYISECWCTDATGVTYRRNVAADTDLMLLDDELMLAGLEWRWLRKKGLSYSEEFASYERLVSDSVSRDATKPKLYMDDCGDQYRFGTFVPVGSWNV